MAPLKQIWSKYLGPIPRAGMAAICASALLLFAAPATRAAISWDSQELTGEGNPAGSGTQWWFDNFNWSGTGNTPGATEPGYLPPANDNTGAGPTDTQINTGTATLPGGEGVVYDPANDPHFANAGNFNYPSNYGPQTIHHLYISRNTTNQNTLTIKGDLTILGNPIVGRSGSSAADNGNLGRVVQLGGTVSVPGTHFDIANREDSGWGNGIYDYRGGIFDNSATNVNLRLGHGSSAGTGGHGRLIVHNPDSGGYIRAANLQVASHAGSGTGAPDGELTGVGILEFHFANGGTRPIQVGQNLSINNGLHTDNVAVRSSRLELVLHEAPTVDDNGVPQNLGLIDVNFFGFGNAIGGTGDLRGDGSTTNDRVFSSGDGTRHFYPRSQWEAVKTAPNFSHLNLQDEDFLVTAAFGNTLYRWEASYTGNIIWEGTPGVDYGNSGQVVSISPTGGRDVMLIGHSSIALPGLAGDHNGDGVVDASDYVLWRKNPTNFGGEQGYTDWRANFGRSSGAGSGAGLAVAAVPEPGTAALVLIAAIGAAFFRRR